MLLSSLLGIGITCIFTFLERTNMLRKLWILAIIGIVGILLLGVPLWVSFPKWWPLILVGIICGIVWVGRTVLMKKHKLQTAKITKPQGYPACSNLSKIPQIIHDMHISRGNVVAKLTSTLSESAQPILVEAYEAIYGVRYPMQLKHTWGLIRFIIALVLHYPRAIIITRKLGDLGTGLLIANIVKGHLPVEDALSRSNYRELDNLLKIERDNLQGDIATKATKAINLYLDYSEAYWAMDVIVNDDIKLIDEAKQMPMFNKSYSNLILIGLAFRNYRKRLERNMDINLAKVCEVINRYGK